MKLLVKTNLYYILFSALTFIIGGVIFYYVISSDIYNEVDENLMNKKQLIEAQLKEKIRCPILIMLSTVILLLKKQTCSFRQDSSTLLFQQG